MRMIDSTRTFLDLSVVVDDVCASHMATTSSLVLHTQQPADDHVS